MDYLLVDHWSYVQFHHKPMTWFSSVSYSTESPYPRITSSKYSGKRKLDEGTKTWVPVLASPLTSLETVGEFQLVSISSPLMKGVDEVVSKFSPSFRIPRLKCVYSMFTA